MHVPNIPPSVLIALPVMPRVFAQGAGALCEAARGHDSTIQLSRCGEYFHVHPLPVPQGYNNGLTTLPLDDYELRLSPEAAQDAEFDDWELETVRCAC